MKIFRNFLGWWFFHVLLLPVWISILIRLVSCNKYGRISNFWGFVVIFVQGFIVKSVFLLFIDFSEDLSILGVTLVRVRTFMIALLLATTNNYFGLSIKRVASKFQKKLAHPSIRKSSVNFARSRPRKDGW